jgi:glycosyltransferase involved in cell wall biosynthesis
MKIYEGRLGRRFDCLLAVSEKDKQALETAMGRPRPVHVVPIGIDTEAVSEIEPPEDSQSVLHMGTMFWPPNAEGVDWFIRRVMPLVRTAQPGATLEVIGAGPPRHIRRLAGTGTGVTVHGYVENPDPYLARTAVAVVPLLAGGGVRVKILELLARGLPVVSTRIGCEGLTLQHERHLLIADEPQRFAEAVLRLLKDRHLSRSLGRNGRAAVEQLYDYRIACQPLKDIIEQGGRLPPLSSAEKTGKHSRRHWA